MRPDDQPAGVQDQRQRRPTPTSSTFCCLCCLMSVLSFVLWMFDFFGFFLAAVDRQSYSLPPKPEFQVTSLCVTNFHVSTAYQNLTANWTATFQVRNPSTKHEIYYKGFHSWISYRGETLTTSSGIQLHRQDAKNVTSVDAEYLSLANRFVKENVAYGIDMETGHGKIGLDLIIDVEVKFKPGVLWSSWWLLEVPCGVLEVKLSDITGESGNLIGGAKPCREGMWL